MTTDKHKLPIVVVTSAVLFAALFSTSITISAFAQNPFDITTEQNAADQQALITVKLATNNTVVIPSNGTVIEVPGNVTQIDNDTVVVTPSNDTVTELPGNVTIITPPEPEPCGCPEPGNETAPTEPGPIDPVLVTPAPGQIVVTQNGTELVPNETQTEPIPIPEPADGNVTTTPEEPTQGNDTTTEPVPEPMPPVVSNDTTQEPPVEEEPLPAEEESTNEVSAIAPSNFLDFLGLGNNS